EPYQRRTAGTDAFLEAHARRAAFLEFTLDTRGFDLECRRYPRAQIGFMSHEHHGAASTRAQKVEHRARRLARYEFVRFHGGLELRRLGEYRRRLARTNVGTREY